MTQHVLMIVRAMIDYLFSYAIMRWPAVFGIGMVGGLPRCGCSNASAFAHAEMNAGRLTFSRVVDTTAELVWWMQSCLNDLNGIRLWLRLLEPIM